MASGGSLNDLKQRTNSTSTSSVSVSRRPSSGLDSVSLASSASASGYRGNDYVNTNRPMHSRNGSSNSVASGNSGGGNYSPLDRPELQPELDDCTAKKMSSPLSSSIVRAYVDRQYAKVSSGFASLSNSPSELWKAFLLKFLDSYSYFSFSLVFTLFLSDDFGMSDVRAGTVYGAYGALITVFGLFTGTIIDNLGVAKCLRIGFLLSFLSRVAIFATDSRGMLLACVLVTLPFGNCLGIPVLTVGIRRYTSDENRGFAFGLFRTCTFSSTFQHLQHQILPIVRSKPPPFIWPSAAPRPI